MSASVKLITQEALSRFADLVYARQSSLYRLWLISPWIGLDKDGEQPLSRMLGALRKRQPSVIVVTRKPELAWHERAVQQLSTQRSCQIYACPDLHTKLYIAECDGFRAAVLGSPNLTPAGNSKNKELAIEFRALQAGRSGDVERLISDLLDYARELRAMDKVKLMNEEMRR